MNLRSTSTSLICGAAVLLLQACAENYPASAYAPPPQLQANPPQNGESPGAPPVPPSAPQAPNTDDVLVAPIALYPDPLIALILPASTVPSDIAAASSYMIQYGDPTRIDGQPWDSSVRALAHYPKIIAWMAQNLAWTEALGSAFLSSPADIMEAVQRMRARALASGTLASTPQQQVYSEDGQIEIYPAQPDSVYVPVYDDAVVYSDGPYYGYDGAFINFGEPCPAGPWLSFYFDWGRRRLWAGDRNVWRERNGWQPPRTGGNGAPPGAHAWHPTGNRPNNFQPRDSAHETAVVHPHPMPGAPSAPPERFKKAPAHSLAPDSPLRVAQPKTAAPPLAQARPGGPGSTPSAEQGRTLPPPPARTSAPPPSRGGEPTAPHSEPARASAPPSAPVSAPAPASAPSTTGQQPQK
jgi:hypothetical protein